MATSNKKFMQLAKDRLKRGLEFYDPQRKIGVEDTKFAMGDSDNQWQWPTDARTEREGSRKVCLTVNLTAQHCNNIINQIRQNRPAIKVSPADDYADPDTAEILAGLVRNIHATNSAADAQDTGAEHAIYGGEGYWRVLTEYEDEKSFKQVITIKPINNPNLVVIDPDAQELDRSDAKWGFVFEDISHEEAERKYKFKAESWAGDIEDGWVTDDTVRIAEYFYCDIKKDTALLLEDGSTVYQSEYDGDEELIVDSRPTERLDWKWCKLVGGSDKPQNKTDWLGDYLPIISVVGKEVNVDGEVIRKGIVRDLKDPARMVNYSYSEAVQSLAIQNNTPYIAAEEAMEGHQDVWETANVENYSVLPWNAYDPEGNQLPKPEKQQPKTVATAQIQMLQLSTEEMRGASGQQASNFGIKSEAKSGVGIQKLKAQGEIATFHFPDNLARALRYEARVIINLIQKYYDTERVVRILGLDGAQDEATINPDGPAFEERKELEGKIARIFNPQVGRYDVTLDTGPSFQTQRQEAAAHLNELAAKSPNFMGVAGDLVMKAQDFPMADDIAKRLEKTLPPELRDQEEGQEEVPPQVAAQLAKMKQAMEQSMQVMDKLAEENESLKRGEAVKMEDIKSKERIANEKMQSEQRIEIVKAENSRKENIVDSQTTLKKATIDAEADITVAEINNQPEVAIEIEET